MKEKMKVYHGLPKTPTNESTIMYASFNGSVVPEIGGPFQIQSTGLKPIIDYKPSVTNLGLRCTTSNDALYYTDIHFDDYITVDFWDTDGALRFISKSAVASNGYVLNKTSDNVIFWGKENTISKSIPTNSQYKHFRFIIKKREKVVVYVNGNKLLEEKATTYAHYLDSPLRLFLFNKHGNGSHTSNSTVGGNICDLHITKGNLGDNFSTLPQDFIDGKAIVVPSFHHRQSYGDPVLNQVTNLLVPAQSVNEIGKYYSTTSKNEEGLEQCLKHPHLFAGNWHNWIQTHGKFTIKCYDNTTITGVFDTDTALAKVVRASTGPTNKIYLDTVDKLVVGDKFLLWEISTGMYYSSYELTVQSINTSEKSITTTSAFDWNLTETTHYICETTTSSSAPVVKTVDGVTVAGTWTGLGTSEATFTMGSNTGIEGKDLVVTYCLNDIGGMSPFPKMPKEVIRGFDELGNEMTPVKSLSLTDSFRGKITGSLAECPHVLKYMAKNTNPLPTDSGWKEFTQKMYNANSQDVVTNSQGYMSSILVEIDLVKFVEYQIGEEIPGNKVDWINKNIRRLDLYATVTGKSDTGNKCYLKYFNNNTWIGNVSVSGTSPQLIRGAIANPGNIFDSKFYILLHADASGTTSSSKSTITLYDVCIDIEFHTYSRYDYLFTDKYDFRGKLQCNPILIDKQTKEVSRLISSCKPFTTEIVPHSPDTSNITSDDVNIICNPGRIYVSTHGTGNFCSEQDVYRGLIGKLGTNAIQPHTYFNENILTLATTNANYPKGRLKYISSQPYTSNFLDDCFDEKITNDALYMIPRIANLNGKLHLFVTMYKQLGTGVRINETISYIYYEIPNRPLIK